MLRKPFDQFEQFLCHYTTRYAAMAHILPLQTLRFSPFELMRDPLEAKERRLGFKNVTADTKIDSVWQELRRQVNESANSILKKEFKVLSMTSDSSDNASSNGMFGRGYARPRMWENYAESHRGVCLLFSHATLSRLVEGTFKNAIWTRQDFVKYRPMKEGFTNELQIEIPENPTGVSDVVEKFVDEMASRLLFNKYDDYASEQEYRFVARSEQKYLYVGFGDCLCAVVIGAEFPEPELTPLLFQCAKLGAALLRMGWQDGLGQIEGFYNPTIPIEHNHSQTIDPYRAQLAQWHPTLQEYESRVNVPRSNRFPMAP